MGAEYSYERIEYEKPIHKIVSDYIIQVDGYDEKLFHVLIYDFNKNENIIMACTGFLLVNKGRNIFYEFNYSLLCWIYDFDDKRYLMKIKNPIMGPVRLLKITEDML